MYVLKISFLTLFPSDSEQKPCHKQRENGRVVGKWHPLKKNRNREKSYSYV